MTKFKKIITSNGRTQYWMDGRMVSVRDLPEGLAVRLQDGVELEMSNSPDETVEPEETVEVQSEQNEVPIDPSICVVCGEPATSKKFLQLRVVGMCLTHRNSMTTGEVVQVMREKQLI